MQYVLVVSRIGQILRLPAVVHRIQQSFPAEEIDESVLLSTIRVPKKLLSLTNRLPKPAYDIKEEDKHNRHTTVSTYLPMIGKKQNNASFNLHLGSKQNYKKLFGNNIKKSGMSISRITPSIKQLQPLKAESINQSSDIRIENTKDERRSDARKLMMISSNREEPSPNKEYELGNKQKLRIDFEEDKMQEVTPIRKYINKKDTQNKEEDKGNVIQVMHNKYLKRRQRLKQSLENDPSSINKSRPYKYSNSYISNSYLRQIINKRSPASKSSNYNMQILANIYAGNPQLSLIAKRLQQSIKRAKIPIKHSESPSSNKDNRGKIKLKPLEENYNILKKDSSRLSKAKLEPVNIINYNKDLQAIGIRPQPLLPTISYKNT